MDFIYSYNLSELARERRFYMSKTKKQKREAEERRAQEEAAKEVTTPTAQEGAPVEEAPAEEETEEPSEEAPTEEKTDDVFEVDAGKAGGGKSALDIEKFKAMIDRVEEAMTNLGSDAVRISLPQINKILGTNLTNNNSFAYRIKTGRETKPILAEHELYVGSRGSWNGPVAEQKIAFVRQSK